MANKIKTSLQFLLGVFLVLIAVAIAARYFDPTPCAGACGGESTARLKSLTIFLGPVFELVEGTFGAVILMVALIWLVRELYCLVVRKTFVNLLLATLLLGLTWIVRAHLVTCFC